MTKVYDDNDGDIDGEDYYNDRDQEEIMQEGSELFKELMEVFMIGNYIENEMYKKRVWLLRKLPTTIRHEDINFYMNKATDKQINQAVIERTMELANA